MDLIYWISTGALIAILIFQQFFYMRQIQTLIDKLMCRSLTEYTSAVNPQPPKIKLPDEYMDDSINGRVMEHL